MTLRVESLNGPDAMEMLTAEWELLDKQLFPRTPFTSPLWANLWWKHLRQMRKRVRHEFFVHVLRDHAGRLVAIVPLVVSHQPAHGPLQLRVLQFFGASDGSITEHRRIICRRADEAGVIQALTRYLHDLKSEWDLFLWTGIRDHENAYLQNSSGLKMYGRIPEYIVSLPTDWESFRSGLSRNMREKVRKSYKLLARNGHTFVFRSVERPQDIPAAIDRFLALHSKRAQLRNTFKHRDYFADESRRAFIVDCVLQMAQRDQLRIFELEIGGEVVASRVAFVLGREMYFYYSGYDPSWMKHSAMTTLMCECFKWAIARGVRLVNLSTGNDPSKLRWKPCELLFHNAVPISPTLRGRLAFHAFKFLVRRISLFALTASAWVPKIELEVISLW
jgi:CelD/BcsL family acetyltransferase involved in cellulose biosynthesis